MGRKQNSPDKMWNYVNKNGPIPNHVPHLGKCWIWTKSARRRYGRFCINFKIISVHRLAYVLTFGEVPNGLFVLHKCDNPACCNPDHLWLGTDEDNKRDMLKKRRNAFGERSGSKTMPHRVARGERQGASKLSDAQVIEIRAIYANGEIGCTKIGRRFGVCKTTIQKIVKRIHWTHV